MRSVIVSPSSTDAPARRRRGTSDSARSRTRHDSALATSAPDESAGGAKLLDHERDPVRARRELHDLVGHGGRAEARRHHGDHVLPVERRQLDHR